MNISKFLCPLLVVLLILGFAAADAEARKRSKSNGGDDGCKVTMVAFQAEDDSLLNQGTGLSCPYA